MFMEGKEKTSFSSQILISFEGKEETSFSSQNCHTPIIRKRENQSPYFILMAEAILRE